MRIITSIALALAAAAVDAAKVKGPPTINQSKALDDTPPPEPVVCEDDQSTLVITVVTDNYPYETGWILKKSDGPRDWSTVAKRKDFLSSFTEYSDTFCLDSGATYRWSIFDDYFDGLCFQGVCGSYTVNLDGLDIGSGARFGELETVIATGGDCVDGMGDFLFVEERNTRFACSDIEDYLETSPEKAERGCLVEGLAGGEVLDYCPGTCGAYGYGRRGRCCDPCVDTESPTGYPTITPTSFSSTLFPTLFPTFQPTTGAKSPTSQPTTTTGTKSPTFLPTTVTTYEPTSSTTDFPTYPPTGDAMSGPTTRTPTRRPTTTRPRPTRQADDD